MEVVKLIVTILTGVLALITAATQPRDNDGKFTPWGRILISALSLSLMLSVVLLWLETREQDRNEGVARHRFEVAVAKHEQTLKGLEALIARQEELAAGARRTIADLSAMQTTLQHNVRATEDLQRQATLRHREVIGAAQHALTQMAAIQVRVEDDIATTEQIQKESAAALGATQDVLANVLRVLTPLSVAAIEYEVVYQADDPRLQNWIRRLQSTRGPVATFAVTSRPDAIEEWSFSNGRATTVQASADGDVAPRRDDDEIAAHILLGCGVLNLELQTAASSDTDLAFVIDGCGSLAQSVTPFSLQDAREHIQREHQPRRELEINFVDKIVKQRVILKQPTPTHRRGTIQSTRDLRGATVRVQLKELEAKAKHVYAAVPGRERYETFELAQPPDRIGRITAIRLYPDQSMTWYYAVPIQRLSTEQDTQLLSVILQLDDLQLRAAGSWRTSE